MGCHSFISSSMQKSILEFYKAEEAGKESADDSHLKLQKRSMQTVIKIPDPTLVMRSVLPIDHSRVSSSSSPIKIYDVSKPDKIKLILSSKKRSLVTTDEAANQCLQRLRASDAFYRDFCQTPPVATPKETIQAYVHDPSCFNNARWDGEIVHFGNVDKRMFSTMATDSDIVNHELGHAINYFSVRFIYARQSGALDESIADVFAMIAKHQGARVRAGDEQADWGFARIVVQTGDKLAPLRSFSNPGSAYSGLTINGSPVFGGDNQVKYMRDYTDDLLKDDYGGVHKYSGIPNHGFYIAAKGLAGPVYEKGGIGEIWYKAAKKAASDESFAGFAQKTISVAKEFGKSEGFINEIRKGWWEVGVLQQTLPVTISTITSATTPTKDKEDRDLELALVHVAKGTKQVVLTSLAKETAKQVVTQTAKQTTKKIVTRTVATRAIGQTAKQLSKNTGKNVSKQIPIISLFSGLGFGIHRAFKGEWEKAGLEIVSGIAGSFPGVGTAVSVGIDVGLAASDAGII